MNYPKHKFYFVAVFLAVTALAHLIAAFCHDPSYAISASCGGGGVGIATFLIHIGVFD